LCKSKQVVPSPRTKIESMDIGIVGLGLIGASLGFDFRAAGHHVIGVSRQQATCETAIALGAVDQAGSDFSLLNGAEVVFLCTPLGVMQQTAQALIPYLLPTAILTDVGSVKASVVETLEPLWTRFVGGHPMAGKETAGIASAQPGLFVDRPYVDPHSANGCGGDRNAGNPNQNTAKPILRVFSGSA
jgi:arogenate dehydrogenase (NADP+)